MKFFLIHVLHRCSLIRRLDTMVGATWWCETTVQAIHQWQLLRAPPNNGKPLGPYLIDGKWMVVPTPLMHGPTLVPCQLAASIIVAVKSGPFHFSHQWVVCSHCCSSLIGWPYHCSPSISRLQHSFPLEDFTVFFINGWVPPLPFLLPVNLTIFNQLVVGFTIVFHR